MLNQPTWKHTGTLSKVQKMHKWCKVLQRYENMPLFHLLHERNRHAWQTQQTKDEQCGQARVQLFLWWIGVQMCMCISCEKWGKKVYLLQRWHIPYLCKIAMPQQISYIQSFQSAQQRVQCLSDTVSPHIGKIRHLKKVVKLNWKPGLHIHI